MLTFVPAIPALIADHGLLPALRAARDATWLSGEDPSRDTMVFFLPPGGRVLRPMAWVEGTYVRDKQGETTRWYATAVLDYFHKRVLMIAPSSER